MANYKDQLLKKLEDRTAVVGIMGLGYVGLPLAVVFAEAGFKVIGVDPIAEKVKLIQDKQSYILDVPTEKVARLVESGKLEATTDFSRLLEADAVSICVPTPLRKTGDPDISFVVSAADALSDFVHPGMVVALESSTYPGTTRELVLPRLTEESGLVVGEEIFIAFSPERVDPGREDWTTINTPKVVGGMTEACMEVAAKWYAQA
ncbi:MAG: UDP-N-acetyl-D-glucosamine dehydrogenase, partial [Anaerolineaceae bacterium]|nr:UDP-N-acetyl-D-glucosamine dehydrogenase [Anaerolineaceae bacterium]